jgi:MSHA biogenesis protein MshJ
MTAAAPALLARFDKLSLRERVFVAAALLAGIVALWDTVLMQPLRNDKARITQEMTGLDDTIGNVEDPDAADPRRAALTRATELQAQTQNIDAQLKSTAAGFIPAQRMVEVIHDVLSKQKGLRLVSLRNLPVTSLVPPAAASADATNAGQPATAASAVAETGPYIHPIELILEGDYSDVLTYLQALEALPWRFRWKTLDLSTRQYPVNRVRIELSTLSMDKTWLGV